MVIYLLALSSFSMLTCLFFAIKNNGKSGFRILSPVFYFSYLAFAASCMALSNAS